MPEGLNELTNHELGQQYYGRLDAAAQELFGLLQSMKDGAATNEFVEKTAAGLAKLRKDFTDATPFLPSYDQRNFDKRIKQIENDLEGIRASIAPKSKFAFKRKAVKPAFSESSPNSLSSAQPASAILQVATAPPTSALSISGYSHRHLTLSSLSSVRPASDLTITSLDHCIVNLVPSDANADYPAELNFSALHASNLSNCMLILPIITGSALLHDMTNCVIALGSRQFRIHTSSQVNVYISIASNPIIEHSSAMRFAAYPPSLKRPGSTDPNQPDGALYAVQDFSHIRATPSPNWSELPNEAAIQAEQWPLSATGDVDELLLRLLPSGPRIR